MMSRVRPMSSRARYERLEAFQACITLGCLIARKSMCIHMDRRLRSVVSLPNTTLILDFARSIE